MSTDNRLAHDSLRQPGSALDWEEHRAIITQLYFTERIPLREVIEILKRDYQFFATDRQYKRRIKQWGLGKNIKDADLRFMAQTRLRRKSCGKDTIFRFRHHPVEPQKIDQYIKRKKLSESMLLLPSSPAAEIPAEIRCYTPSTSPTLNIDSLNQFAASRFDPFGTLPVSGDVQFTVDTLLKHYSGVLLSTEIPTVNEEPLEGQKKMEFLISAALSEPGVFFACMSLSAVHRVSLTRKSSALSRSSKGKERVMSEQHFYMMTAKAIGEMNKILQDPAPVLSDAAMGIIIIIVASGLLFGLFDDTRAHVKGLAKMIHMRGGLMRCIPQGLQGVLVSVAMGDVTMGFEPLSHPFPPITWQPQAIPAEVKQRIFPPASSSLSRRVMALCTNPLISQQLKKEVQGLRDLLFLEEFDILNSPGLTVSEYEIFCTKVLEIWYEIMNQPTNTGLSVVHPIEHVARLAVLSYIVFRFYVNPSGFTLSRTLVGNLKKAFTDCSSDGLAQIPSSCLDLLAWATFLGAFGSYRHVDRLWFAKYLREIANIRGWYTWKDIKEVLYGYLYIPRVHDTLWRYFWDEAIATPLENNICWGCEVTVR